MTNLHQELQTALAAVRKAQKVRCTCPNRGMVKLGLLLCKCQRAETIRLAVAQRDTVLNAIRQANQKERA